jgi:hypothetical protein
LLGYIKVRQVFAEVWDVLAKVRQVFAEVWEMFAEVRQMLAEVWFPVPESLGIRPQSSENIPADIFRFFPFCFFIIQINI